jgi:transposase
MTCNRLGYNSQRSFEPQVNLLFIFSPEYKVPLYYRMVAGDVRETKALKLTLEESGIQEAIVIGDKGFYSKENIENLSSEGLDYILPIRRSHSLCEYEPMKKGNKELFDDFFAFDERIIWYKKYKKNGHDLILFLDNKLKEQEEKDYLLRIKKEDEEVITDTSTLSSATNLPVQTEECQKQKGNTLEKFYEKQHSMGTITLHYSLKKEKNPEEIFTCFKSRNEVENTYDAYKNILEADTSYMQGQAQMETWSFINFLALIMYFRIYKQLLEKQMLKKYAPKDILLFLEHIKKMKINDKWLQAEITKKSQTIIDMLRT